jgi:hypothetical protein
MTMGCWQKQSVDGEILERKVGDTHIKQTFSRMLARKIRNPWSWRSRGIPLTYSVHDGWGLSDNEKGNAIFHGDTSLPDLRVTHKALLESNSQSVSVKGHKVVLVSDRVHVRGVSMEDGVSLLIVGKCAP